MRHIHVQLNVNDDDFELVKNRLEAAISLLKTTLVLNEVDLDIAYWSDDFYKADDEYVHSVDGLDAP